MGAICKDQPKSKLVEIARLFFKLGTIAFGGPAAHIAMMEDEVVRKRKWMTPEHFLDLVGATNLIPGPNSTEMTMHCGHERAGWRGLVVAGLSFITPAVMLTSVLAWLYQSYGTLPEVAPFIYGIKPAVISIILMAGFRLGKKAVKNTMLIFLGVATVVVSLVGVNEISILFGCGAVGLIIHLARVKRNEIYSFIFPILFQVATPWSVSTIKVFLVFLKVGAILYGSGYVLFAFLDSELVVNGILSRQELLDAVAVGQMTPGPVLSTATFIGWQLHGLAGALAATIGIFLPSFIFVLILNPLIPRLRGSKMMGAFLDAVNVAAVGLILAICIKMGQDTLTDWRSILIALGSLVCVFLCTKLNSAFIVLGGALAGYCLALI